MYFTDIFFTLIPIQLEVPIAAPHSSKNMNPFYIMFLKDKTFHTHTPHNQLDFLFMIMIVTIMILTPLCAVLKNKF